MGARPLEGIRVIEVSVAWAGPVCGMILAGLGAEVIKIESPSRPDTSRGGINPTPGSVTLYPKGDPGERPWNRAATFHERHRNKLSLALDLAFDEGKDVFKALVALSDVVIVNYRADTMKNLGLDYPVLREVNPALIMIVMPGFGSTGPYKAFSAYGSTLEAVTGAAYLTGYPDREPLMSGFTWPDPASGTVAAGAVMAAIFRRIRTGEGMLIELSQMEVAIRALGGAVMDFVMNGRVQDRTGNRHTSMAPHGCYPCLGDDQWLTIAVAGDKEWRALCEVMGMPALADDPRFADVVARHKEQDELDRILAEWTIKHDKMEAMSTLQEAGVTAGAVLTHAEHLSNHHFLKREFFEEVHHPEVGTYLNRKMTAFNLSETPAKTWRHAPLFGEHNSYLLRDLLGLSDDEVQNLAACKVVSDRPLADPPQVF